ncbi:hypothetical protein DDZ13_10845 [Coraliomargarita sinensis]|uniref:Uncharacterized protein n=1 Tax=Coraliomargarita sinensis TaxID=2174842 RepID=A0A317ZEJ9_9BACT|nr:hypothetical protein [Coraliomargarita sinensis]PXA03776.1 hypothetical protein DDZ13_10845 [Coraliomargarita sinensis]
MKTRFWQVKSFSKYFLKKLKFNGCRFRLYKEQVPDASGEKSAARCNSLCTDQAFFQKNRKKFLSPEFIEYKRL